MKAVETCLPYEILIPKQSPLLFRKQHVLFVFPFRSLTSFYNIYILFFGLQTLYS